MAGKKKQGRSRRPEAVRQRVLDAALAEFMQYGFEAANTNRVAERFRGAKTTIFRHYGNKRELFLAVIERSIREGSKRLNLAGIPDTSPREWLVAYSVAILQWLLTDEMVFVANMADYHRRDFPEIVECFERYGRHDHVPLLANRLRAWTAAGLLDVTDFRADAEDLLSLVTVRLLNRRKFEGESRPSDAVLQRSAIRSVDLFLNGRSHRA